MAGAGPAARPTQGAGERREASEEAVTGREQRGSGSGNGAAPDPARPARRRGAAGSHFLSNSPRPRGQRPAQPPLPRDWRGHAHQRPRLSSRGPARGLPSVAVHQQSLATPPCLRPRTPASCVFVVALLCGTQPSRSILPGIRPLSPPRVQAPQTRPIRLYSS